MTTPDTRRRYWFQSTRPRGARPEARQGRRGLAPSFNPRAHEGRDPSRHRGWCHGAVSIHAPTRGATPNTETYSYICYAFQSTRPRGARRHRGRHARHGRRVSIHAPTRGATAKVYSDMHDTSALIRFSRTDEPMIREFCNQDKWQQEKLREPPTLSPSLGVRAATAYLKCIKSPLGHRHH